MSVFDKYKPESATSVFDKYKSVQAPPPQNDFWNMNLNLNDFGNRFMQNINPATYAEKAVAPAVVGTYQSTIQPVARGAIGASYGGIASSANALGAQISGKSNAEIEAARRAPIEVPGFGNVNPTDAGNAVGMASGVASGAFNTATMLNPASVFSGKFLPNAAAGALGSIASDIENKRDINWLGAAGAGLLQGTTAKVFAPKIKRIAIGTDTTSIPTTKAQENAIKAGIPESTVNYMDNLTPEQVQKANNYMKASQAKVSSPNPDSVSSATEQVADQLSAGVNKLDDIVSSKGSEIGKIREMARNDTTLMNVKPTLNDMTNELVSAGAFKNPDTGRVVMPTMLPGDENLVNLLYNGDPARKLVGLADNGGQMFPWDLMQLKKRLYAEIYAGKSQGVVSSEGESMVKRILGKANAQLHDVYPALAELDDVYSELVPYLRAAEKKTGNPTTGWLSGINGRQFLRNTENNTNGVNYAILSKLQDIGRKYNIPELAQIVDDRRLAQIADDVFKVDSTIRPTSLGGIIARAGADLATGNYKGAAINATKAVTDKAAESQSAAMSEVMKESLKKVKLVDILKNQAKRGVSRTPFLPTKAYDEWAAGFRKVNPEISENELRQLFNNINK